MKNKLIKLLSLCTICAFVHADEGIYELGFTSIPTNPLHVGTIYRLTVFANLVPGVGTGAITVFASDTSNILNLDAVNGCQINYGDGEFWANDCQGVEFIPTRPGSTTIQVNGTSSTSFVVYPTATSPVIQVVE